jgi:hypothetical protein
MKDNCKHIETENIKKIYNKDFDVLIYNFGKKPHAVIIDKRDDKTIVYNTLEIASHHIIKQ